MISTKTRSSQSEWMDNMEIGGQELRSTLVTLGHINNRLGGNRTLFKGLNMVLKNHDKTIPIRLLDIGCGDGDQLRRIAKWGARKGYNLNLTGLDANPDCIAFAKERSVNYPEITYLVEDVFAPQKQNYHIVTATLFLHHFKGPQIVNIIKNYSWDKGLGIVVNDLHRSRLAYYLFHLVCLFIKNPMIKNDGLISILRGFKRKDLNAYAAAIGKRSSVKWRWAFRFQWIIFN